MNHYRRRLTLLEGRIPKAPAPARPSRAVNDPEARGLVMAMARARNERRFDDHAQLMIRFAHRLRELDEQDGH